jgi:hypothetical protein
MKVGMKEIATELGRLNAATEGVIIEYKHIDQEVKRWEGKLQVWACKVDLIEECQRENIVIVFGLHEERNEGCVNTVEIIQKIF